MFRIRRRKSKAPTASNPVPMAPPTTRPAGLFQRIAAWTIRFTGGQWGFLSALLVVIAWAVSGPFFHYSELWQLVINTGTTIITFLMVFLIQNAQNRESKAVHLKLDELIFAVKSASNAMMSIENLTDEQLDMLSERYHRIADRHARLLNSQVDRAAPAQSGQEPKPAGTSA